MPPAPTAARLWPLALLAAILLPIWVGPYPALYDYQAHLLEARVVRDFTDPALGYAEGFVPRPGWMADSNALMTLVIVGLSRLLPLDLAGQAALSLALAIGLAGLWGLLRRAGTAEALLPLAGLLAYNYTFASGWLNFALATGLGLCALSSYEDAARGDRRALAWLALLALLIYSAHLVIWGLLALVLGVRAAADGLPARRLGWLALAGCAPLPLILAARPLLAAIVLIAPLAWLAAWLVGRLRLPPPALALAALELALAGPLLGKLAEPWLRQLDPAVGYALFERATFPIRTFTLAQQLPERDPLLSAVNIALAALLLLVAGLLAAGAARAGDGATWRRLAPLGALLALYGFAPSQAGDIAVVEPRIMLWAALVALAAIRLPPAGRLRRAIGLAGLGAALLATGGYAAHSLNYQRQAAAWRDTLLGLGPRPALLVVQQLPPANPDPLLRLVESRYNGVYFSARAPIELGGFSTRVFGNGPFYLRPDLETGAFLWRPGGGLPPDQTACAHGRGRFSAALAWGPPDPPLRAALEACYGAGAPSGFVSLWRP